MNDSTLTIENNIQRRINNYNTNQFKQVKRRNILNSLLKTIAKTNSNPLIVNEVDSFFKQYSYTHLAPKVRHK